MSVSAKVIDGGEFRERLEHLLTRGGALRLALGGLQRGVLGRLGLEPRRMDVRVLCAPETAGSHPAELRRVALWAGSSHVRLSAHAGGLVICAPDEVLLSPSCDDTRLSDELDPSHPILALTARDAVAQTASWFDRTFAGARSLSSVHARRRAVGETVSEATPPRS